MEFISEAIEPGIRPELLVQHRLVPDLEIRPAVEFGHAHDDDDNDAACKTGKQDPAQAAADS